MSSTFSPPVTGTLLANKFRSTFVYGVLNNLDNTSSNIPARAAFQRDVLVGNNLFLGNMAVDASDAFLDSTANIQYTLDKTIINFPVTSLRFLKNITSDVQQQIIDLSNNITNNNGASTGSISALQNKTTDISWTAGQINKTTISNQCETNTLTFSNTLNNISSTAFSYLSGLNSNIQEHINNKNNFTSIISQNIGNQNTAFGLLSFSSNSSGKFNSAFGYSSLNSNVSGSYNTAVGDYSLVSSKGEYNTAIGHFSQLTTNNGNQNTTIGAGSGANILNGSCNVCVGQSADISNANYSTAIGYNTNCGNYSNATAIGYNAQCTAANQMMVGTYAENVVIPGNLSCNGLISGNRLSTSGDLTCNGLLSGNRLSTNGDLTGNGLISGNRLSTSSDLTCNGLLSTNRLSATGNITFTESINNITATVFGFLNGVTSSIQSQLNSLQNQINAISNTNPPGTVIQFAGSSATLQGYLPCNGDIYNSSNYNALFNAIGTIYGDGGSGTFRVPDYRAVFLRGAGQQNVRLNVIAGGGGAIFKGYTAPELGRTVVDQSEELITSSFVDNINTQVKSVVTGSSAYMGTFSYTNAISSLNFTTNNNGFHYGNQETHPVHASVQYFIKY